MKLHFIGGLPRAGSTLLSALLAQNPRFQASITSPLFTLAATLRQALSTSAEHYQLLNDQTRLQIYRGLFQGYYGADLAAGKELLFDSNRSWPQLQALSCELFPESRMVLCVRSPAWVVDSFEQLYRKNQAVIPQYLNDANEARSVYSRTDSLMRQERMIGSAWSAVREAFYGPQAERVMLVDYTALAAQPEATLRAIYQFIGEPWFEHWYSGLVMPGQAEIERFDYAMGLPGLHRVGSAVRLGVRPTLLPPELYDRLDKMAFWRNTQDSNARILLGPREVPAAAPTGANSFQEQ